jgi:cytochrome d ubiquinol oxidase subunit I
MVTAAYLTTAFVVGGVAAYYLWNKRHIPQARIMLGMATIMAALVAPLQVVIGDMHGLNTLRYQPAKVAAMEGLWETQKGVPLLLFAIPIEKERRNGFEIGIPKAASLILTHDPGGEVKGLNEFKDAHPPVAWVFYCFRVMVGLGLLMVAIGAISAVQYFRGKLFETRWLHGWWMLMMPSGFIAILAGWFVTEIGRQPWTAYGIIRTAESVSPAILGPQVAWSLLVFVVMYIFVFGAGSYYILKLIGKGIPAADEKEQFYRHSIEATVTEAATEKGGNHV